MWLMMILISVDIWYYEICQHSEELHIDEPVFYKWLMCDVTNSRIGKRATQNVRQKNGF